MTVTGPGVGVDINQPQSPAVIFDPVVAPFALTASSSITRLSNTTTYTVNTGWNNGTPKYLTFNVAAGGGGMIQIVGVDIYSSANPTLKLTGNLWIFNAVPGTLLADNAAFLIASADYANLVGGCLSGYSFTLANTQSSGAANSGVSIVPAEAYIQLKGTALYGMVEVTNAYVPASGEILTVTLYIKGADFI